MLPRIYQAVGPVGNSRGRPAPPRCLPSGASYLRGSLFEQFGDGAVDKAAGLSLDLQKVQRLQNSSAHFHSDTTSEGLEELRDLITGNDSDGLIAKIMEVFPARE